MTVPRIRPAVPAQARPEWRTAVPPVERVEESAPPTGLVEWAAMRTGAPGTGVPVLLPLEAHRRCPAEIWAAVAGVDSAVTAILDVPDRELRATIATLAAAGVRMLGRVDLERGRRPVAALVDDVAGWAGRPVHGLVLDHCPPEADELGAVALAVRHAERLGLAEVLLAPGAEPHPRYRCLGARIVGFAGSWLDYQRTATRPGDAHLVHDVPVAQLDVARRLIGLRGAAWALASPVPLP
ncbi:hypothetical protein [Catenuloplanes atrovinosus]|uniref:Uncharacterized protein n=1 Tax=Catenuloplanes atrovinosus TaxID=137266 RepID=A0AAE4C967_9ACTN|nr:hypothetical protein [Catenuloplanes atrovinosus]MDR7273300.1 hypothetical protein [Catenuloplanes atrovinosus]